jgi:NOL1/NOP2/sun family putative RNA methylase
MSMANAPAYKKAFIEDYRKMLGDRVDDFLKISKEPLRKSIRINTLKKPVDEVVRRFSDWKLKQVPWCSEGFYVDAQAVGNAAEHTLGYFYVQEAASMIPPVVLEPEGRVLDLCASPGSKTTQMAAMMRNEGSIIANDLNIQRISILRYNLQRCGVYNTMITRTDGSRLRFASYFDRVLVDAPCSGTGAIRKNWEIINMWSKEGVKRLASTQRDLILKSFDSLKSGGIMVYSTCALSPEENEAVVDFLLKKRDAEVMKMNLKIKRDDPVLEWEGMRFDESIRHCLRIYPQTNDSEGFFVAKVMRNG